MSRRAPRQATELFFSEYVEGSSNNKALEIYNGTSAAVNLTGYSVEMYFNGGTTPNLTHQLSGTIAAGDVFVLSNPLAALPGILSASDQTTASSAWYNGDDAAVLKKGSALIDAIGQVGFDPGTEWGTGLVSTADRLARAETRLSSRRPSTTVASTLAQTFKEIATGAKFTALAAHLKSKGSSCSSVGAATDPNGQGECNQTRVVAMQCIRQAGAAIADAAGDSDLILLVDMSAYGREDLITNMESNGFIDVLRQAIYEGPQDYDYVFSRETGALTHALANTTLNPQISSAKVWHIDADEPRAFDYNDFNQSAAYSPDPYRIADHDPLAVWLNLTTAAAVPASDARWLALAGRALAGVARARGTAARSSLSVRERVRSAGPARRATRA